MKAADDYMDAETGFLVCGNCHAKKQKKISFLGEERVVGCLCRCAAEKLEKERARHEAEENLMRIRQMKSAESLAGRNQEIDDTFISLYADKAKGILTEKRFLKLTDAMEKEQEKNQNRMQEIAVLISEEEHSEGDVRTFMEEIKRYAAVTELDEAVLNRLINRILIGKPEKIDGVRTQEVRIVYNFVGEL